MALGELSSIDEVAGALPLFPALLEWMVPKSVDQCGVYVHLTPKSTCEKTSVTLKCNVLNIRFIS